MPSRACMFDWLMASMVIIFQSSLKSFSLSCELQCLSWNTWGLFFQPLRFELAMCFSFFFVQKNVSGYDSFRDLKKLLHISLLIPLPPGENISRVETHNVVSPVKSILEQIINDQLTPRHVNESSWDLKNMQVSPTWRCMSQINIHCFKPQIAW